MRFRLSLLRLSQPAIRILASGLLGLTLVAGIAAGVMAQRTATATGQRPAQVINGGIGYITLGGSVNLASLPAARPPQVAQAQARAQSVRTDRLLKSPIQLAAARRWALAHPGALPAAQGAQPPRVGNTFGNGALPVLMSKVAGLNSTQTGGWYPPDQAIAAGPGYVIEGVNAELTVYNTAYGQLYGPWTPVQLFASVLHTGDTFSDPQITYHAQRAVYLISWLELTSTGKDYIDLAVSKGATPSPLTVFNVYQIDPTTIAGGADDFCDYETLGYDYWGAYVTCVTFSITSGSLTGNNTFAFNISQMVAGSMTRWNYWNTISTTVNCATGCLPAYRLSPAMEDGAPQAEWISASDTGWGATSSNLTLCAITNTASTGSSTTTPTFTCDSNTLPLTYDDPIPATEPGTTATVDSGFGYKQVAYRNGQLYFAMTTAMNCSGATHDGVLWTVVDPQLTTLATNRPQHVNGIYSNFTQAGLFCITGADTYMPTLAPGSEGEMTLVYNYSSSSVYPSIGYTGRAAEDAPNTMGQGGASGVVVAGIQSNDSGRWGDYSACALYPNGASRGTLYCGGEYGGPNTALGGLGWDTELYTLRME